MNVDFTTLGPWLGQFLVGTEATLYYSTTGLVLALAIGLFVALGRLSRGRITRGVSRVYTDIIRGTPLLVQIFFIYFGSGQFGLNLSASVAGVLAMGINSGAYVGEIFRAGIQSIDRGQMEAARSLGMSHNKAMRRIIIPQALRRVIPPLTGEATNLVKGTSLLAIISISELTRVAQVVVGVTFRPIEAYSAIAVIYFIINWTLSQGSVYLERRLGVANAQA